MSIGRKVTVSSEVAQDLANKISKKNRSFINLFHVYLSIIPFPVELKGYRYSITTDKFYSFVQVMLFLKAGNLQEAIFQGLIRREELSIRFPASQCPNWPIALVHDSCRTQGFDVAFGVLIQQIGETNHDTFFNMLWFDDTSTAFLQSTNLVMDMNSMQILASELSNSFTNKQIVQAAGFVFWEWELLQREGETMRTWWRQHLKGCKALRLQGMTDINSSSKRAKCALCKIGRTVCGKLAATAHAAGVSLFSTWQGVFAVWAHRSMEEESGDVVLVGPYGRRDMAQFQRTVGYLLNMVVYRYRAETLVQCDLVSLARESGRVIAEAIERGGNYPFSRLVREAGVENAERLMDVTFNWVTGQDLTFVGESRLDSKNPFTLRSDGVMLSLESTLFDSTSQLHDVLGGVMARVVATGTTNASAVQSNVLQLQEEEWGTGPTLALGGIVPVTFQGAVRKFMKSKFESKLVDLSFVAQGKAGDVIGMHMRRSERLVWLTYSITLQGYAFLPLDAGYGAQVVEYRLNDAKALVCFLDEWRSFNHLLALRPDTCCFNGVQMNNFRSKILLSSEMCYILFTSGTTGRPKGAAIGQLNVANLLQWSGLNEFQFCCEDLMLWQSSISFDMLILDLFWPLQSEGFVCAVHDGKDRDLDVLGLEIRKNNVSILFIVPSHFLALELTCKVDFKQNLRCVVLGGESLTRANFRNFSRIEMVNFYGPTETTVGVMSEITSKEAMFSHRQTFPVGRAFANTSILTALTAFVRGLSVGMGYQNMSQLTKQAFVYDSSSNDGENRMYDTGDKVEFNPTGAAHHLGRKDDQVKISGQRVELGAVESAVLSCPGVSQCTIVVVENSAGNKSLAAFVVVGDKADTDASAIREHMTKTAARHELPHQIQIVNAIPLTTSGKADRAALKRLLQLNSRSGICARLEVDEQESTTENNGLAANSGLASTQMLVASAMSQVIGEVVSLKSKKTFWELGGTSLMAMTLDGILQSQTGVRIGIAKMMLDGSVAGISSVINSSSRKLEEHPSFLSKNGAGLIKQRNTLFVRVTAGQEGLFVVWKTRPEATNYTVIAKIPLTNSSDCVKIVESIIANHTALRTRRFLESKKQLLCEVLAETHVNWMNFSGVDLEVEKIEDLHKWNLEDGSELLRVSRFNSIAFLFIHHILIDEWSWKMIQIGQAQEKAPLTQMWEFAEWEWELLQREGETMRTWWRQHLKGCKALRLQGMTDINSSSKRAKCALCKIGRTVCGKLAATAHAAGVSLFSTWQGVFAVWAHRSMEEESGDVVLVGPYGRRDMAQFQRTVGYLLNMVVYRYRAETLVQCDLVSLARESGRVIAEAIERGGNYPFSRLVREAGVENAERLMDVTFNWVTGQDLTFVGESRLDSKNPFTLRSDGVMLSLESTLFDSTSQLHDVLGGVMARVVATGTTNASAVQSNVLQLQEEEWGTGPTLALGGIVPVTFQGGGAQVHEEQV